MDLFRVRLNCVDHYQSSPTQFDPQLRSNVVPSQRQSEPKVPVIRVFGSTETGQKVCAHIHGAFPYLYIEYTGSLVPDEVGAYIYQLHLSIDHALAVSYRRNVYDDKVKFVARITLVKGTPFYGFHVGYRFYLKVYMLNPMVMTRLSDLLRQGVVMKKIFQPFEAHLQYLLQWMADYNLYGCGYIDSSQAYFRGPVPKSEDMKDLTHLWHDDSIPPAYILPEGHLPRVSHCSIEVDIRVQDILNRLEIKERPLHHDFLERLNPLAPDEKLVHSMAGLWRDETRRRKSKMGDANPGSSPFPPEVMVSMSADPRSSHRGGWIHEDEYRGIVKQLIEDEKAQSEQAHVSFQNFIQLDPHGASVKTALESVEDLYPQNLAPILGLNYQTTQNNFKQTKAEDFGIDERIKFTFDEGDEFPYESDEDVMREIGLSQLKRGDNAGSGKIDTASGIEPKLKVGDDFSLEPDKIDHSSGFSGHRVEPAIKMEFPPSSSFADLMPKSIVGDTTATTDLKKLSLSVKDHIALPLSVNGYYSKQKNHDHDEHNPRNKRRKIEREANTFEDGLSTSLQHHESEMHTGNSSRMHNPAQVRRLAYPTSSAPTTVNGIRRSNRTSTHPKNLSHDPSKLAGKASEPNLGFAVVKDPNDLTTLLRLSQNSSSQKSTGGLAKPDDLESTPPGSQNITNSEATTSLERELQTPILSNEKLVNSIKLSFPRARKSKIVLCGETPPNPTDVVASMQEFGLPAVIYQDAFYSAEADVPERAREWAGREFRLESTSVPYLPPFDPSGHSAAGSGEKPGQLPDKAKEEAMYQKRRRACKLGSWEIAEPPPTAKEVEAWVLAEDLASHVDPTRQSIQKASGYRVSNSKKTKLSQIDGPTQKNPYGFKYTQNQKSTSVRHEVHYMSTMSLEVHVNTRGTFVPNPEEDEIQCIFWCLQGDDGILEGNGIAGGTHVGIVVLSEDGVMAKKLSRQTGAEIQEETSELDLLIRMVEIVRTNDPDILTGYEVHGGSWGYLIERARLKYDYNLCDEFSRMKSQSHGRFGKENDKWGFNNTSTIRVTGRHMINIWRAMRSELNLLQYTMENVVFHILHKRIPHYAWPDLTSWYTNGRLKDLAKVVDYYISRVQLDLEILEQNELIQRTSEQARLLGVDFFSVFSRGSQFKVESLMFRIAKPENFILVSPSRKQVGGQNALECLPLVMEPQSAFYNSPLLVLDFQSLYPSVMIAYNYCYSTFLGRVVNWRGTNKMGFTEYKRQEKLLELLKDYINIAPNGIMYVKPEIRKSLLAKMLSEILETRIMVKSGMKVDKEDKMLQMLLNNRQLALKLIANVTYGYTSASFSGRMPCSEIADSIVQTGRETLERAIALIHSVKRWGAEVVYGDTDSLFVYLKGRSKDEAFDIGNEIAKTITNTNPRPVKLKFEKVYFPCVLLAKKRYVGFKYESKSQTEPEFDAKGIETVRRDGTPAEQKIEEKALKLLFRTADLSQVKSYFQQECEKIMKGSVSIQDFCFAREVKLGTYSDKGPPPPGALISTKRMLQDHRAEPQYGERVPYVVITGAPGARLIDRCVAPETLLNSEHSDLDAEYYISKNLIPPLERIFNLVGANVRNWYDEMPKTQRIRRVEVKQNLKGAKDQTMRKKTLESYMKSSSCLVCKEKLAAEGSICAKCIANRPVSILSLRTKLSEAENKLGDLEKVCRSCSGFTWADEVKCDSQDCPVFYTRVRQNARVATEKAIVEPVIGMLESNPIHTQELEW